MDRDRLLNGRIRSGRYARAPPSASPGELSLHVIHFLGRFLRLLSVYAVYQYLLRDETSVTFFMFVCSTFSALVFMISHRPRKGRSLSSSQLVPTIVNGAVLALSLVVWGQGLRACGPVRTVLSEYVGAVVGSISTLLLGRKGQRLRKVAGIAAMIAAFFFLSEGWAMASHSPFNIHVDFFRNGSLLEGDSHAGGGTLGFKAMSLSFIAGLLGALRRVIARRVSLKVQLKKRLHAITFASAASFLFPFAIFQLTTMGDEVKSGVGDTYLWAYSSNILFGTILIFYIDAMAEERLHILNASTKHLVISSGCIIVLELFYKSDFSLVGFLICSSMLGLGIFAASSLERLRRDPDQLPGRMDEIVDSQSSLIMSPIPP